MAGGTFTSQNKKRPGAYINFKAVPKPLSSLGSRGVATMPLSLPWGEENKLISITSEELVNGASLEKIGLTVSDGNKYLNECLKNCYKLLVWKINAGGKKATATSDNLVITAKCFGSLGNKLKVVIKANSGKFDVMTYLDGDLKDKQSKVSDVTELKDNSWVNFTGTGNLEAQAGIVLEGGTDGEVTTPEFSSYFAALNNESFNTMGIPFTTPEIGETVEMFISGQREIGKYVQAVIAGYDCDHEGIIKVKSNQGYKTETGDIDATGLVAFVTGITAGANVNKSNTYAQVSGAISIIGEITDNNEVEEAIDEGWLILTRRSDGVIVIEQDINSLHTFTTDKPYEFSKNRVIRTLDEIGSTCRQVYEQSYIGKVDNNDIGRSLYKSDLIAYLKTLQGINAVQNFDADDIDVLAGEAKDAVVVNANIQTVDSMEKLYMTVSVG